MRTSVRQFLFLVAVAPAISVNSVCGREVPVRSRVVDVIILRDGTRLLGTVKEPVGDESVTLLMRGRWLRDEYPKLFNSLPGVDNAAANDAVAELKEHLRTRTARVDKELERTGFLNEQITRLQADHAPDPDLVLMHIPAGQIRRRFLQPSSRRPLAFAAILNQVEGVETITEVDVRERVSALGQNPVTSLPAESTHLATAERILIRADRIFGKVSRLIAYGDTFVSEADAGSDIDALAAELLAEGVRDQLSQLLSDPNATGKSNLATAPKTSAVHTLAPAAAEMAVREKADIVEVTSMRLAAVRGTANVAIELYRQGDDRLWRRVLRVTESANARDITPEQKARIEKDPRVQQVLRLFDAAGIEGQLAKAVAMGAVVEVAQQRARQQLEEQLYSVHPGTQLREVSLPAKAP